MHMATKFLASALMGLIERVESVTSQHASVTHTIKGPIRTVPENVTLSQSERADTQQHLRRRDFALRINSFC